MWMRRLSWAGVGLLSAGAAGIVWSQSRWHFETNELANVVLEHERTEPATVNFTREFTAVPPVVARYFKRVLRDGQPMITSARVTWRGEFNMGTPGRDNWRPFTAVQTFNPAAPGFVWNARIRWTAGIPVLVRDGFVNGQGMMRGAVFGAIPVVDAPPTPELAAGALQRYLGEAAWLPTALLPSQGVVWSVIDDSRARASLRVGPTSVSLDFHFDGEGRNISVFTPDRIFDDGNGHPEPRPWGARTLSFVERDGMLVGNEAVAEWYLPGGTFVYWRGAPVSIVYDYASPGGGAH
jgi:hypothetical protein